MQLPDGRRECRPITEGAGLNQRLGGNLVEPVDEAKGLQPRLAGLRCEVVREHLGGRSRQRTAETVGGRPPDLGAEVVRIRSEVQNRCREQQRLRHRDDLRLEVLLRGLAPEQGKVRRRQHAGQDLHSPGFELAHDGGEIRCTGRYGGLGDQRVTTRGNSLRKDACERPAIGVIRPQCADLLVGADLRPHPQVNLDHILQTPEEVIGPLERLRRVTAAPGEPRLPRSRRGDARYLVRFALVRNRVDGVQRRPDQYDVHAVDENQVAGRLSRPGLVRLAVPKNDVHRVRPSTNGQTTSVEGTHRLGDILVCDTERGQRSGLRAHIADADGSRRSRSVGAATACGQR